MTLCMAAIAKDTNDHKDKLLLAFDKRAETFWAGGDVIFKLGLAGYNWPALVAGDVSRAEDFLATCRATLLSDPETLTMENVFDKFNRVSSTHKEKLCKRFVEQQLGISFERFLAEGEHELTPEVRSRVFQGLQQIEFDCEVIVCGYIGKYPQLFEIDKFGDVTSHQNFAAIGTGSIVAKSTLYQRTQKRTISLNKTLYHFYEAAKLAHQSAPSVGEIDQFVIIEPIDPPDSPMRVTQTTTKCFQLLEKTFKKVGPKRVTNVPMFDDSCWLAVQSAAEKAEKEKATSP